jgi:hypothetical protein
MDKEEEGKKVTSLTAAYCSEVYQHALFQQPKVSGGSVAPYT